MSLLDFFSERDLLERIKNNDRTALGELFIRYRRVVFSQIKKMGGGEKDAEDMLQEAIIVLWQKAISENFRMTAKISTYLVAVAKNKWLAESRKRRRFADNEPEKEITDGSPDSLESMIGEEQAAMVQRALNEIQALCKQLLTLFYFEQRSMEEIARILHFANTNVAKSKKYQCKKALEKMLFKQMSQKERRI